MNLALWLQNAARVHGRRPAIGHGTAVHRDYRGFAGAATATARYLRQRGVHPGERVGIFMDNAPDYLPLLWGIWWAGAAVGMAVTIGGVWMVNVGQRRMRNERVAALKK